MTRLLLIRHGQTTSNVTLSLDTRLPGASLTELGWKQAFAAGERIATEKGSEARGEILSDRGLLLVSSQALRARQTAAGIMSGAVGGGVVPQSTAPGSSFAVALGGLEVTPGVDVSEVPTPVTVAGPAAPGVLTGVLADVPSGAPELAAPGAVPGISEIPAGDFEMRSDPEAHEVYHRTFATWLGGSMDLTVPGALDGRAVVERYLGTLMPMVATAQATGSDLAVVSHGAVIRLIAGYLGRVDPEYAVRTLLPNTSRVELEVPDFGTSGLAMRGTVPELPTVDAPMVHTASYVPAQEVGDAVSEGWKVTDWAGHGEPPRVG